MRVTKCDKCGREFDPEDREGAKGFRLSIWTGPKVDGDLCIEHSIELVDLVKQFVQPGSVPKNLDHG